MLTAYPVAYTGLLSVTDAKGAFVGLENFQAVLSARATPQAFWNTLWWVGGSIVFQVLLGTATGDPAQPELPRPRRSCGRSR